MYPTNASPCKAPTVPDQRQRQTASPIAQPMWIGASPERSLPIAVRACMRGRAALRSRRARRRQHARQARRHGYASPAAGRARRTNCRLYVRDGGTSTEIPFPPRASSLACICMHARKRGRGRFRWDGKPPSQQAVDAVAVPIIWGRKAAGARAPSQSGPSGPVLGFVPGL
jgi:hypothetical protein